MQRKNLGTAMRYLVVVCALISAFAMVGCGGGGGGGEGTQPVTSGETLPTVNTGSMNLSNSTVQALEGQQFVFPGSIFDPSLAGTQSTLTFTGSGSTSTSEAFDLNPGGGGDTTFGSCTFTFTRGRLAGKSVKFDPCTIQITASNVTVGGGAVSGTLTFTLVGPFGSASVAITVQIRILADGTLEVNGKSFNITISTTGTPVTSTTGTGSTGTGGTP